MINFDTKLLSTSDVSNNSLFNESYNMGTIIKKGSSNQINRNSLVGRCSVNDTLMITGKRWLMMVLYEISLGNNQFSALQKSIPEISQQVLATRIQDLVDQELITKHEVMNTVPTQVTYLLSKKAEELLLLMDGLFQWTKQWSGK